MVQTSHSIRGGASIEKVVDFHIHYYNGITNKSFINNLGQRINICATNDLVKGIYYLVISIDNAVSSKVFFKN